MNSINVQRNTVPPMVLHEIVDALSRIQFGSIEIQIHNGVVVQLERKEKKRWDKSSRTAMDSLDIR